MKFLLEILFFLPINSSYTNEDLSLNLSCSRLNIIYEEQVKSNVEKFFLILMKIGLLDKGLE